MSLTKKFVLFGQRYDNAEVDTEVARLNSLIKAKDKTIGNQLESIDIKDMQIKDLSNEKASLKIELENLKASLNQEEVVHYDLVSNQWKNEEFYIEEEVYEHIILHDSGLNYTPYDENEDNQVDYNEIIEQRKCLREVCMEYWNLTLRKPKERSYKEFLEYLNSTPVAYALYYDKGYVGTPLVKKR